MTNKDLRWFYALFNKRYFSGKLPDVYLHHVKLARNDYGITHFLKGCPVLTVINKSLKHHQKHTLMTLLHEMGHIKLGVRVKHGPKFQREMRRLARLGAFDPLW